MRKKATNMKMKKMDGKWMENGWKMREKERERERKRAMRRDRKKILLKPHRGEV